MEISIEEVEDSKIMKDELLGKQENGHCRCAELEHRSKKAQARCVHLESEVQKKEGELEVLEAKLKALEAEKLELENELKNQNQSRSMGRVVDLSEENEKEDAIAQLTMENSALEYEKKAAKIEAEIWKEKFVKLKLLIQKLHENGVLKEVLKDGKWALDEDIKLGSDLAEIEFPVASGRMETDIRPKEGLIGKGFRQLHSSDSPYNVTPGKDASGGNRGIYFQAQVGFGNRVRKHLSFGDDRSSGKKIAPLTPRNARPASSDVIDICDSDEEPGDANVCHLTENTLKPAFGTKKEVGSEDGPKEKIFEESYEDKDVSTSQGNTTFLSARKRKRVINSDSESDEEGNIPICKLKKNLLEKQIPNQETSISDRNVLERPARRRLTSLRQCEEKVNEEKSSSSEVSVKDDESEGGSDSDGESLDKFIVEDDAFSNLQSDESMEFDEIISRLRRNKDNRSSKWEFEADMLADFGKDPELCMRAVCVLYRMQTSDEKESKSSHYHNQRGFSKFDASRGTTLGEFLTDGDPEVDLKKSVEDLHRHDPEAVEVCRTLAIRYSKQLFKIYKNQEDPFFHPS